MPSLSKTGDKDMNSTMKKLLVGASLLGSIAIATPAFAGDTVQTTVNPVTGATTTVEHHGAILPRNRSTTITTTPPAAPAYPPVASYPSPYQPDAYAPPAGTTTTTTTVNPSY
jgi:hypothetical protein